MGFMTEVGILNDRLSEIEQNPEKFVRELVQGIRECSYTRGAPYITGQTEVLPSHHADQARVLLSWHNSFISFEGMTDHLSEQDLKIRVHMMDVAMRTLTLDRKYLEQAMANKLQTQSDLTAAQARAAVLKARRNRP